MAASPLTRQDALLCANRYADIISRPATRIDSYYSYCRLDKDPDHVQAASWPGFAEEFWPEISDRILPLFQHMSPELELWLFEYVQQQWPQQCSRLAPKAHKPGHLLNLMLATGEPSLGPLHIAAALGLSKLCDALIRSGADVNQLSALGTPLYCGLVGPRVFLREVPGECDPDAVELAAADCPSIAQEDTLRVLADAGATGLNVSRPRFDATLSVQSLAFLTCLRLRSPSLFKRLYPPPPDRLHLEDDAVFRKLISIEDFTRLPWGKVPASQGFITAALPVIFDAQVPFFEEMTVSEFLVDLWYILERRAPAVTQAASVRPLESVSDENFPDLARRVLRAAEEEATRRLAQDPRWDPNLPPLTGWHDETFESSFLHLAVESDSRGIVSVLVQSGADIHSVDAAGRTPLHLAESVDVLEMLINHGAKTTDTDEEGRTIWHIAAANNDTAILKWLIAHDPQMENNLKAIMKGGRTAIAQAIIYPLVQTTNRPRGTTKSAQHYLRGARLLLDSCTGRKDLLQSQSPLLSHAAVEWGDSELLLSLRDGGLGLDQVDDEGNSPLHRLNLSATERMLYLLRLDCENLPLYNDEGLTPLETMFFNTFRQGCPRGDWTGSMTAHPAFEHSLNMAVYEKLIAMVVQSGGSNGEEDHVERLSQCWERYVDYILIRWASTIGKQGNSLQKSVLKAMNCLVNTGCLDTYESHRKKSAVMLLVDALLSRPCFSKESWWHLLVFSTMSYASMVIGQKNLLNQHLSEHPQSVEDILCWIIANAGDVYPKEWVRHLLTDVFSIPAHLNGEPTMLYVCRSRCSLSVFESFARNAPRLTEPDDVDAASKELHKSNWSEAKLKYFHNAHARLAEAEADDGADGGSSTSSTID